MERPAFNSKGRSKTKYQVFHETNTNEDEIKFEHQFFLTNPFNLENPGLNPFFKSGKFDTFLLFKWLYMKHEEITYKIIACTMEVHRNLGPGYPEYIYHRALIIEFKLQNVRFEDEYDIRIIIRENRLE